MKMNWPRWWEWELEITPHIEKRMEQRDFTEVELREMMGRTQGYRPDIFEGRWIIETQHRQQDWEIVVEPDPEEELLVVVTAYPV